jgi:Pentapeptide repeats (8 copies)
VKFEIKTVFGAIAFSTDAETFRDAVVAAVKSGADLINANLSDANLYGATLSGANLYGANLINANLINANLINANLRGADLRYADLSGADLINANLINANLINADLCSANLKKTRLPSPTVVLLASWGNVSDKLCADLMEYDAWTYGDKKAFKNWVKTGKCPYTDVLFERAANFSQNPKLFGKGKLRSPIDLMNALFKEKEIKR